MLPMIYDGSGQPAPTQITLRAGALSAVYENGLLRYIRLGDHEVLRGVYAAVRDQNWGTIPGQLSEVKMDIRADSFAITFTSDHHQGDVDFVWHGAIRGDSESRIRFTFEGTSLSTFRRNRIGFCVLHPSTLAGAVCLVEHVDGEREVSRFPAQIAPEQPIYNIRAITHEVMPEVRVEVRMDGDAFELEDQRNWTDASYKTYCTPLDQPYPVEIAAGTVIQQSVTVQVIGQPPIISVIDNQPTLEIDTASTHRLPPIGLSVTSSGDLLSAREIDRLKALHLAHLRVDLQFDDGMEDRLRQAVTEASALGCKLELALHLGDHADAELRRVRAVVDALPVPVARWLILRAGAKSTPPETIALARRALELIRRADWRGDERLFHAGEPRASAG